MKASKSFDKSFNSEKVEDSYEKLVGVFQESKLNIGEIVITLSNLLYTVGASIEGYKDEGPDIELVQKMYYSKPTIGNALMSQAVEMSGWFETLNKQEKIEEEDKEEQETKETKGEEDNV